MKRPYPVLFWCAGLGSLLGVSCSSEPPAGETPAAAPAKAGAAGGSTNPLEGLWSGSWGGSGGGDVIFTPVLAAVAIEGDHFAAEGLPEVDGVSGLVRVDEAGKRLTVTHAGEGKGEPQMFRFAWKLEGDHLTLTDDQQHAVSLRRQQTARDAAANVPIELVAASGITPEGDLVTTAVAALHLKDTGRTLFQQHERKVSLKQAVIFAIQAEGGKEITVDEARKQIGPQTLVALAHRPYDTPSNSDTPASALWTASDPAPPESEAALRTLSRTLKSGTLVFVLPPPTVPQP